jgi:hypothetical protein
VLFSASLALAAPAVAQSSSLSKLQENRGGNVSTDDGPPIAFYADLSADEESAETYSPGAGRFDVTLDRKALKFSWKVTYANLTSPLTSAAIHGPQTPGGEAAPIIDLAPKGLRSPMEGSVILTEGQLEYLLTGRMYVNLHTVKYPRGELRGHLSRQRPSTPPEG